MYITNVFFEEHCICCIYITGLVSDCFRLLLYAMFCNYSLSFCDIDFST